MNRMGARMRTAVVMLFALALASPVTRAGEGILAGLDEQGRLGGPFLALEGHASLLSDLVDWSYLAGTFGYCVRGGYRWADYGLFASVEQNFWLSTDLKSEVVQGAINIGFGGEIIYGGGLVHTSFALGPSILAFDTILDSAGTTGLFIDFRPLGLRWAVHEHLVIGLDPIAFALVAPVLDRIPLIYAEYRTLLYVEGSL